MIGPDIAGGAAESAVRVLLFEDDEVIGGEPGRGLGSAGLSVEWSRADGALQGAVGETADVVVLDLGLPDVDGVEVARAQRRRRPDVLILILAARSGDYVTMASLRARLAADRHAALTERAPGDPLLTVVRITLRGFGYRLDPGDPADVADGGPAPHDRPSRRA